MSGEEHTPPINDEDTSKSVNTKKPLALVFIFTFLVFSAGFLIWNYYVTMPMPASTFTLAVGHWQQVAAEIPPESGDGVGEGADRGKTATLLAWTEAGPVSGLGCSTVKIVTGSPLQDSRYFINFPIGFCLHLAL